MTKVDVRGEFMSHQCSLLTAIVNWAKRELSLSTEHSTLRFAAGSRHVHGLFIKSST